MTETAFDALRHGDSQPPPAYALYPVKAIGWATFLGSPIVGGVFMAINFGRLGRSAAMWNTILASVLGTGGLLALATLIPENVHIPDAAFHMALVAIMTAAATSLQGAALSLHRERGGLIAPTWHAVGSAIVFSVAVVAVLWRTTWGVEGHDYGKRVTFGKHGEVYYSGEATRADAMFLGGRLTMEGYFGDDGGGSVRIEATAHRYAVSFVLADGAWDKREVWDDVADLGSRLAEARFGRPLTVNLCDDTFTVKHSMTIE